YFHQGGGWNQNARFALARAIVDDGTFAIDDQLVYQKDPDDPSRLRRLPIVSGNLQLGSNEKALAWRGVTGTVPVDIDAAGTRKLQLAEEVAATGDLAYYAGHFHPNKA